MKKPLFSVDALSSGEKQLLGRSKEAATDKPHFGSSSQELQALFGAQCPWFVHGRSKINGTEKRAWFRDGI